MSIKKKHHVIRNAYDAYWFLYDHPKLNARSRVDIPAEELDDWKAKGWLTSQDVGGKCYRYFRHHFERAIYKCLDIHYTKTNQPGGHGRVDKDGSKNKHVECWLEFGPCDYGYLYSASKKPLGEWDTETILQTFHDVYIDTGGSTFDEGLISLAKNVLKKYGDYDPKKLPKPGRCKVKCPECAYVKGMKRKRAGKK